MITTFLLLSQEYDFELMKKNQQQKIKISTKLWEREKIIEIKSTLEEIMINNVDYTNYGDSMQYLIVITITQIIMIIIIITFITIQISCYSGSNDKNVESNNSSDTTKEQINKTTQ